MARAHITYEAVLSAITEFDSLGRDAFLANYGFGPARDYMLVFQGKHYDSKAITAVAHKWAPDGGGKPLTNQELSGGQSDSVKLLRQLGFEVTQPDQNSDWTWDEHVLALSLYMANPASPPSKGSPEIRDLSLLLNRLGRQRGVAMSETFRNPNGVYMKLMNFRRLDPVFAAQGKVGLGRGNKGEESVWDRFKDDLVGLKAKAAEIKEQIELGSALPAQLERGPQLFNENALATEFERFKSLILANEGRSFRNFQEGLAATWEGYKPSLRERALDLLDAESWSEGDVGTGAILEKAIAAIEIQDQAPKLTNNLVFWQNRFGHANREHRVFIEAQTEASQRKKLEFLLFQLYRGDMDEGALFDELIDLVGAKYPLLAYLFFLKDIERFAPIQPTTFDGAFQKLGVSHISSRNCSWENYFRFNAVLEQIREALSQIKGIGSPRLIDAHSFCWLLVKLPSQPIAPRETRKNPGRVIGGAEKSVVVMRHSIQSTTQNANGQLVERTLKNKDLLMNAQQLDRLLASLLEVQDNRCALTGIPFHFHGPDADRKLLPSPDRIDSNGHYEHGNLQIVCQFINFWKRDTPDDEFRRLLMLVRGSEGMD